MNKAIAPSYKIIEATPVWSDKYSDFCQKTFSEAYYRPDLGVTRELFSNSVFKGQGWMKHSMRMCGNTSADHKLWLAIDYNGQILGTAAVDRHAAFCEMKSFYTRPDLVRQGIGRELYAKVLGFCGSQPIQVDVVQYMNETIRMYEKWGFEIDKTKGMLTYPWEGWPEEALKAYQGVFMVRPGSKG